MPRWRQAWTMVKRMAPRWPQSPWPMKSQFFLPTAVGRMAVCLAALALRTAFASLSPLRLRFDLVVVDFQTAVVEVAAEQIPLGPRRSPRLVPRNWPAGGRRRFCIRLSTRVETREGCGRLGWRCGRRAASGRRRPGAVTFRSDRGGRCGAGSRWPAAARWGAHGPQRPTSSRCCLLWVKLGQA